MLVKIGSRSPPNFDSFSAKSRTVQNKYATELYTVRARGIYIFGVLGDRPGAAVRTGARIGLDHRPDRAI